MGHSPEDITRMTLFIIILLFSLCHAQEDTTTQATTTPRPDCDGGADACNMDDFKVLKIKCVGEEECTCDEGTGSEASCTESGVTDPPTKDEIDTADKCEALCETQAAAAANEEDHPACKFWRWESFVANNTVECTLNIDCG